MIKPDTDTDAQYNALYDRHDGTQSRANGYRLERFFQREQSIVLSALDLQNGPFLDVASGSGLMLAPLLSQGHTIFALDFNEEACEAARHNGITTLRGDAFNMPLADNMMGQIVNCGFFNQQSTDKAQRLIEESARVLKPGGQLIILWRHANSLIHKTAYVLFTLTDRMTGQPSFPQYEHPIEDIKDFAQQAGLEIIQEGTTLPYLSAHTVKPDSLASSMIGASLFMVLRKP